MKLSVLIPMYNAENYISNCIDSLLNQDIAKEDYEIIIMDDGSKDNSVAIVEKFATTHNNIRLYKEANVGAYSTRNKLLKLAKGDYIYNLDADDYIVHNCLERLLNFAEDKNLDFIGFKTTETTDLDRFKITNPIDNSAINVSSGSKFLEEHLHLRHEIWWYFIKKDFINQHQMSFNANEYNADVIFTIEALLKAKRVGYLPQSIHRYVMTQDSLMRSKDFDITFKRINYFHMMITNKSKVINRLKNKSDSTNAIIIDNLSYRRDVFTFFNLISMLRSPFSETYIKEKIKELKSVDAYPIKGFIGKEYNSLTYKTLNFIINNEFLFFALAGIKNVFSKQQYK